MKKHIYFDRFRGNFWPRASELKPYFFSQSGQEWFYTGGNDTAGLSLEGVEETEHLDFGRGRKDIILSMWGNPIHGVLMIYEKRGAKNFHVA